MTRLETHPSFESTSAAGSMILSQVREPVLVGRMLAGLGTSTARARPGAASHSQMITAGQTTAGARLESHGAQQRGTPAAAALRHAQN